MIHGCQGCVGVYDEDLKEEYAIKNGRLYPPVCAELHYDAVMFLFLRPLFLLWPLLLRIAVIVVFGIFMVLLFVALLHRFCCIGLAEL